MEQLIFIVIIAVLGIGKWLYENAGNAGDSGEDIPGGQPPPPSRRPSRPASSPSEGSCETDEERMRRFMEALGLPANQVPPPRRPAAGQRPPEASPRSPEPERRAAIPQPRPNPRHLGEPFGGAPQMPPILRRRKIPAPQSSRRIPTVPPSPSEAFAPRPTSQPEPQVAGTFPSGATIPAMGAAPFPALIPPADPGRAVATAAQGVESAAEALLQPSSGTLRQENPGLAALKGQLRDPASLRRAILLREILGTPKGLQSAPGPSILPTP